MNIGIAGPIEMASLLKFFPNISAYEQQLGLGGTAVNLLIEGLLEEGHQVTVFSLDPNVRNKHCIEGKGIKVIFGHFRSASKMKTLDFCRKEYVQIKEFIHSEKAHLDIVNAHWSYEFAIGTILAKVPNIITFRDHAPTILKLMKQPYRFSRLCMDFWVRKKGDAFSYNSTYLQDLIGLPGAVLPNPIKIDPQVVVKKRTDNDRHFNIFFMSNGWSFLKNPEVAIQAFSKLRKVNSHIHLFLLGIGFEEHSKGYQWTEKTVGLERIHFMGAISHKKVMEMLGNCHLMLHTSREESFGNNLIEAMALGIPVIGGEQSGAVPWVLDHGKAGLLVDIENSNAVADAIQQLLSSEPRYVEFSQKGLSNVKNRFSLKVVTALYLNAFTNQKQLQKTNESTTSF